jgi:hypothetical protein
VSARVARLGKVLSHPLTLLLTGAVVTSLVVPAITRGWQDHQKALAVKSELVEDMTAKTSRFLARSSLRGSAAEPRTRSP